MKYKKFSGAASAALMIVIAIFLLSISTLAAGKYKTLHKFTNYKDGSSPNDVILDKEGNLYSTTRYGGTYGYGNVFELTRNLDGSWSESELYSFCSQTNCSDGANPFSGVTFDQAGNLYGTTTRGGAQSLGSVFKLSPNLDGVWTETVLYSFTGGKDGRAPLAGLIFDQAGNLYGAAGKGGSSNCSSGCGTVFKITPKGALTVLYSFAGKDGFGPIASMIFDQAGNLYGTTEDGGIHSCNWGCGVIFELSPTGDGNWTEKMLHRFTGGKDGAYPESSLIFDRAGNLYGTTLGGGNLNQCDGFGCGVVFELTANPDGSWTESVLHRFCSRKNCRDGRTPTAGLVFDTAGHLYGTTEDGGIQSCSYGCGVVFELSPNSTGRWEEKVLHTFMAKPGALPIAGLVFDATGNLYGTSEASGYGSVFEITP